jgi:glucose-1-phosphate adenylyltransferase
MSHTNIGQNCDIYRCVTDEWVQIGDEIKMGTGENLPNEDKPKIYDCGITVIGAASEIPPYVNIGKNCVICGKTTHDNYDDNNCLQSGKSIDLDSEVIV